MDSEASRKFLEIPQNYCSLETVSALSYTVQKKIAKFFLFAFTEML